MRTHPSAWSACAKAFRAQPVTLLRFERRRSVRRAGPAAFHSMGLRRCAARASVPRMVPVTGAVLSSFEQAFRAAGMRPNTLPIFSAHQMGTCRMGSAAALPGPKPHSPARPGLAGS
jgi:choline dehydrogenase-like flavoprotein